MYLHDSVEMSANADDLWSAGAELSQRPTTSGVVRIDDSHESAGVTISPCGNNPLENAVALASANCSSPLEPARVLVAAFGACFMDTSGSLSNAD